MKKFFLSIVVMLSAVTMNVNAMRDSFLYHMTSEELQQKMSEGDMDFIQSVQEEYQKLYWGVVKEFGYGSKEVKKIAPVCGYNGIYGSIEKIHKLYQQKCKKGTNDESVNYDPVIERDGY